MFHFHLVFNAVNKKSGFILSFFFFYKRLLFCCKARFPFFLLLMSSDIWQSISWWRFKFFFNLGHFYSIISLILLLFLLSFILQCYAYHVCWISWIIFPSLLPFSLLLYSYFYFFLWVWDNVLCSAFISFSVSFIIQLASDCLHSVF